MRRSRCRLRVPFAPKSQPSQFSLARPIRVYNDNYVYSKKRVQMSARPERSCPRPALHDRARIALLLNLAHKLSRIPSRPLSLQLHDKHPRVVLIHLGG